jgi:hypothetical protein
VRHRPIAVPLALLGTLAGLAIASTVVAGGWAQVSAKNTPVDPPAGEKTTIELAVSQHGVTPVSWPDLTVIATNEATGETVRVQATAKGPVGSYVATIVFPTDGAWTLTYDSTDLVMEGWAPVQVAAAAGAPAGAAGGANPAAPAAGAGAGSGADVLPFVVLLFAVAVGLAVAGLGLVSRRSRADTAVSAGSSGT